MSEFTKEDAEKFEEFVAHYAKGLWQQTPQESVRQAKLIQWLGSVGEKIKSQVQNPSTMKIEELKEPVKNDVRTKR